MRKLTDTELFLLGQEIQHLANWRIVKKFVDTYYGTNATHVSISISSEYNDESYHWGEGCVHVYNKDDNDEATPDFTLPIWKPHLDWIQKRPKNYPGGMEDIFENIVTEASSKLPMIEDDYDVTIEPKLSYPNIYVD